MVSHVAVSYDDGSSSLSPGTKLWALSANEETSGLQPEEAGLIPAGSTSQILSNNVKPVTYIAGMEKKIDKVLRDALDLLTAEQRETLAERHYSDAENPIKRVTEAFSAIRRGRWVLVEGDKR